MRGWQSAGWEMDEEMVMVAFQESGIVLNSGIFSEHCQTGAGIARPHVIVGPLTISPSVDIVPVFPYIVPVEMLQ
jgi:hypothetical protein